MPDVLQGAGTKRCAAHCADWAAARGEYVSGARTFVFDAAVYRHESVKRALVSAQHHKCAFCESKVTHVAYGDVEHFRPKAAVRQSKRAKLQRPGYFWLAYKWQNLLFACQICNQRYKANLFPLQNYRRRARRPSDVLDAEEPLFIDPGHEDPSAHLSYREEYPYAVGGSRKGATTWRELGLDREPLAERRRDHLKKIRLLREAADKLPPHDDVRREIEAHLAAAVRDDAEFASATRAALGAGPP